MATGNTEGTERTWVDIGKDWLQGHEILGWSFDGESRRFHKKQVDFINSKKRYVCFSGGMGAGKTDPMIRKCVLLSLFFPGNFGLIGRKTYAELESSTMMDFWDIVPESEVESFSAKNRVVTFKNGSKIIFFHLDVMQSSSMSEQKKALAEIKSMNLGFFAIDQAEEVDEPVFQALRGRLRRNMPFLQGMLAANPAMTWLYDYFKGKKFDPNEFHLIESSTLDNKDNLPKSYVDDLLKAPDSWKRQFVYGEWNESLLSDKAVFPVEYIREQRVWAKEPESTLEGMKIYVPPQRGHFYRIGADPSEGVEDPCAIVVADITTGEIVATWTKRMPADLFAERIAFFTRVYDPSFENHEVVLEINGMGIATLTELKKFDRIRIYEREVISDDPESENYKQGWKTTAATKPLLLSNLLTLFRENKLKIYCPDIHDEMNTFVYSDQSKNRGFGAINGKHDDLIMATMLALFDARVGTHLSSLSSDGYTVYSPESY